MTDEAGFLAAIRANPADDTARLVYADWLDERGDPRGEWLRIYFQLKRVVADGRLYIPLENRQSQLARDAEIDPSWLAVVSRPAWTGAEIRDWREFYDSLKVEPGGWAETAPKPTIAQLDRFEVEAGIRLPLSYREYILVFGPGKLLTDWDIAAPGYGGSWFYDLRTMHENMRPDTRRLRRSTEPHLDRVQRLWYFCSKYKDAYGWDRAEVTDPDSPEYAVYRIIEDGRVERVADSFRGFVEDATLHMLTYPHWDEEELGSPMRFEIATKPAEPAAAPDRDA